MKYFLSLLILSMISPLSEGASQPDKDMKTVLDKLQEKNPKSFEKLSAEEARKQPTPADAAKELLKKTDHKKIEFGQVEDIKIPGPAGEIPIRYYVLETLKPPMPVIVYYHGGGFVTATNDTYDATAKALAMAAKALVVSVEYRKGPEHKFPAAHDDAYAAYKWVLQNVRDIGGEPNSVAVAGESAGGNLALNVALRARDEKIAKPVHQLLIYPVVSTEMNTPSYREFADAQPLNKAMMNWFFQNYARSPEDLKDPRLNLLDADLKGLRSVTIISAEIDPLRSEGEMLARRLKDQGVEVNYQNYDGVTHEFFGMSPVVKDAQLAQEFAAKNLKESFSIQAQEAEE